VLGLAVHEALEKLYQPFKDQLLSEEAIDGMLKLYEEAIDKAFVHKYKGSDVTYGKNLLLVRVARILVRKFLEKEKNRIGSLRQEGSGIVVSYLEKPLNGRISIMSGGKELEIRLKGFIDRIDRIGQEWRIIDYKSGTVSPADMKFDEWDELMDDPDLSKALQLLMYAYLFYHERKEKTSAIRAGIISLRKLNEGFMEVHPPASGGKNDLPVAPEDLKEFEKILTAILSEIVDLSLPFRQTVHVKRCERCDFITLCDR
jgi:ATP-dependent helicase/DNAse subunit B